MFSWVCLARAEVEELGEKKKKLRYWRRRELFVEVGSKEVWAKIGNRKGQGTR